MEILFIISYYHILFIHIQSDVAQNKSCIEEKYYETNVSAFRQEISNVRSFDDHLTRYRNVIASIVTIIFEISAKKAFMGRQVSDDVVRSSDATEEVHVETSEISNKFKFFESYKEPEKQRKQFRITPPRDGQVKVRSFDFVVVDWFTLLSV